MKEKPLIVSLRTEGPNYVIRRISTQEVFGRSLIIDVRKDGEIEDYEEVEKSSI